MLSTDDNEYYYIRYRISKFNLVKSGITCNLYNRNNNYKTNEELLTPFIICIKLNKSYNIEPTLHNYYKSLNLHHCRFGSGKELFKKNIISLVIPFLDKHNIVYYRFNNDELNNLHYVINLNKFKNYIKSQIIPYDYQLNILNNINTFYNTNNIGKIIWAPGLGKTFMSILICKKLNFKKILIGVPTRYLQEQFYNEILKFFPNKNNIIFINSDFSLSQINYLFDNNDIIFIITTYASAYKLINYKFDFKIGDEAHHLVGIDNNKGYKEFHKIQSSKTLFMTATEKIFDFNNIDNIYSMNDDINFGKLIDQKSVNYAIEHKKITDYNVLIISNSIHELHDILSTLAINNIELFIVAYTTLKSIQSYYDLTKILMICNSIKSCEIIESYLKLIIDNNIINYNFNNIYINSLYSGKKNLDYEINNFKQCQLGIIISVYIFGEGFNCPELNSVVICENMESYNRIVQTVLRPNRINKLQPNKKSYIILPYIDLNNNFNNILTILYTLRNIDEQLEQKIKLLQIIKQNYISSDLTNLILQLVDIGDDINKLKLKLINSKLLNSINSYEQNEFNYIKQINKKLNIQSKLEYSSINIKERHEYYIDNPEFYFYNKNIWTNWYDFLQIDTSLFLQSKEEWIKFCIQNNINLHNYNNCVNIYTCLPLNPEDFYINFTNIQNELTVDKRR